MILSILEFKKEKNKFIHYTIFCTIFAFIYELFSHEVYSLFMILNFIFPLIGLITLLSLQKKNITINNCSYNLFKASLLTFTIYFIIKGVLEIYGTTNSLVIIYPSLELILLILSILTYIKKS